MKLAVLILAPVLFVWLPGCAAKRAPDLLTVQETLGAAFMGEGEYNVFRAANPEAAPALRQLLSKEQISQYHANIVAMLGYVGDATDVRLFLQNLDAWAGTLPPRQYGMFREYLYALATLSRRGIKEADEALRSMATGEYWKNLKFDFWEPNLHPIGTKPYVMLHSLAAYSMAGHADWREHLTAFVASIPESPRAPEIRTMFRPESVDMSKVVRGGRGKIEPHLRAALPHLFNGDLENPARVNLSQPAPKK